MSVVLSESSVLFNKAVARFNIDHAKNRLNHNVGHTRVGGRIGKQQLQSFTGEDLLNPGFDLIGSENLHDVGHMSMILQPKHRNTSVLLSIEKEILFYVVHQFGNKP